MDAINRINNYDYLDDSVSSDKEQIQLLYDNAVTEAGLQDLEIGVALTTEQRSKLTKDIIWLVEREINGETVLVTELYLSQNTIDSINGKQTTGSRIIAQDIDLNVNGNIENQGSIIALGTLALTGSTITNGHLTNSEIWAGEDLNITTTEDFNNSANISGGSILINSTGDINNIGGTITSLGNIMLAGNNITNQSTITTTTNGENISSSLDRKSSITSGGSLTLIAQEDIINIAADITSGGDATLQAQDILITTQELRNKTVNRSKKVVTINDTTTHIGSNINIGGNLTSNSTGNTTIKGSDITIAGNAEINTGGSLTIQSAQDSSYSGSFTRRSTVVTQSTTNIESNITAGGNITTNSQDNLNIIASNIEAEGDITLKAKNNINILSGQDTYSYEATSKKKGLTSSSSSININRTTTQVTSDIESGGNLTINSGNNANIIAANLTADSDINMKVGIYTDENGDETINENAKLNILNAKDSEYSYSMTQRSSMDAGAVAMGLVLAPFTAGVSLYAGMTARNGEVSITETYDETIVSSNINAGNGIKIETASDTNIRSSNLKTENGNIDITVGQIVDKNGAIQITDEDANLNIASDIEKHIKNKFYEKQSTDYGAIATSGLNVASGIIAGAVGGWVKSATNEGHGFGMFSGAFEGVKSSFESIPELASRTKQTQNNSQQVLQIASNIDSAGEININSAGSTNVSASNIIAVQDTNITAGDEINITSALETSNQFTFSKSSDFTDVDFGVERGRASMNFNMDQSQETNSSSSVTNKSSNILSNGNINLTSNQDTTISASNIAAEGSIAIESTGGDIVITSNTNSQTTQQISEDIERTISVGVGNSYIDAAYAVDDAVKAAEALKEAKDDLSHMKNLRDQGRATDEAVKDAEANLALALLNYELTILQTARAAANAASTTPAAGFYADMRMDMTNSSTTTNTNSITNTASTLSSGADISLTADSGITQRGSHLDAGGDINYESETLDIVASRDSYNSSTSFETETTSVTLASTAPTSMVIDNVGGSFSQSSGDQSTRSTNYNNSTSTAGGAINIVNKETNIEGANLLALDVNIVTDELKVESLQNELHAKGGSNGFNFGAGSNGSASVGFSHSSNRTDRVWVDNQTSIVGTDSVNITVTGNTHLKGALIANIDETGIDQGNLTLTTGSLTYEDIKDIEESSSTSVGFQTSTSGTGSNNSQTTQNGNNTNRDNNQYPQGSTTISLQNSGYTKEQITRATIGNGNITIGGESIETLISQESNQDTQSKTNQSLLSNLNRDISKSQEITRDTIDNALDVSVTLDHRLFTSNGRQAIGEEMEDLRDNLQETANGLAELVELPLVESLNVPYLKEVTKYIAGEGGSVATLATQLFGLNYLLDSGDTKWQENNIEGLDNETLAKAIQNKDIFTLESLSGEDSTPNQKTNSFTITDKDGNSQTYQYTSDFKELDQVTLQDILNTQDYSLHGIYNTSQEGFRNGMMQLGTIQNETEGGLSFVTLNSPTKGPIFDGIENIYNTIFGKTPFSSANMEQLKDFSQTLGEISQFENVTTQTNNGYYVSNPLDMSGIRMVGHSNGGDRLYLGILGGGDGRQLRAVEDLRLQFYGTPSKTQYIRDAAEEAGLSNHQDIQHLINHGDYVGEGLGRNKGGNLSSLAPIIYIHNAPKLVTDESPHSNYYCQGSFCNFEEYIKTQTNDNIQR
ncbi:MAG: hemagglutinin repeat-containing protein [Proteobacteria bacterium]|nr:hemagglutinin repeat-containing protein [Pseudomonadota bacterium]